MQHPKEAIEALGGDELQPQTTNLAETDTTTEYFERYERRKGNGEGAKDINTDYWLSEDEEEESHQLKAQKWKSRVKKEPYVVQDAKAPKLRPAEGMAWSNTLVNGWLTHHSRRSEETVVGS